MWTIPGRGKAAVARPVHAGRVFDVYQLTESGEDFALKVPARQPSPGPTFRAGRTVGGVSTSWSVICSAGRPAGPAEPARAGWRHDAPATADALLEDEAGRLAAAGAAWNCPLIAHSRGDLDERTGIAGLVTPWLPGPRFDALEPPEQRRLLVRMLPALWDALSAGLHGDLTADNIIVWPDRSRFALIDPGAQVLVHNRERGGPTEGFDDLTFITTPAAYPVLPPYYLPDRQLAAGATLRDHWDSFVRSMTLSDLAPPVRVGANVVAHHVSPNAGRFLTSAPQAGDPHPADLLAIGILYYRVLTGTHPFGEGLAIPAWVGATSRDDAVDGVAGTAARLARGVEPPRSLASVRPGEEALALALLDLQVQGRARLMDLVYAAAAT